MGKKKKKGKKKKSISLLEELDTTLDQEHDNLLQELEELQYRLYLEDLEATKKMRKQLRKKNQFSVNLKRADSRRKIINEMEETDLMGRIERFFHEVGPMIVIIGRLVAALINALLSITEVKLWLQPSTVNRLERIYQTARAIG